VGGVDISSVTWKIIIIIIIIILLLLSTPAA
jgi:hypothetical protein